MKHEDVPIITYDRDDLETAVIHTGKLAASEIMAAAVIRHFAPGCGLLLSDDPAVRASANLLFGEDVVTDVARSRYGPMNDGLGLSGLLWLACAPKITTPAIKTRVFWTLLTQADSIGRGFWRRSDFSELLELFNATPSERSASGAIYEAIDVAHSFLLRAVAHATHETALLQSRESTPQT